MTVHLIFETLGTLLIEHPSKSLTQLSKMLPFKTALPLFCTASIHSFKMLWSMQWYNIKVHLINS